MAKSRAEQAAAATTATEVVTEATTEATTDASKAPKVDEKRSAIKTAFEANAGGDEDSVKMQMIGAGATFKNVTRLFNEFMIDAGLAISKTDRDEIVAKTLEGHVFDTEETFDNAVAKLMTALKGATERSAGALIRSYANKGEFLVYAKPKGEGKGRSGFGVSFMKLLAANPTITKEKAEAIIQGTNGEDETSENVKRHASHYQGLRQLANDIAALYDNKGASKAA